MHKSSIGFYPSVCRKKCYGNPMSITSTSVLSESLDSRGHAFKYLSQKSKPFRENQLLVKKITGAKSVK